MLLDWLGFTFVGATLAGCAALWLVVLGLAWLLWSHFRLRHEGVAREARLLAHPLPPAHALPHVVVQIPCYNEGAIVERAVASAARLDWPRDRLHIQVCDDSADATTGLARAAADRARAAGTDAVVLHRTDRAEFKAGALRAAMAETGHDYFAILDVDYVPPPDYLRRCMAVLLAEPGLGFVQACPDFLNAGESLFTRAQAVVLDFHHGVEQATRSWSKRMLPFSGTCGIWRRAAIEAGGGWRGDMLSEDWDLSYRAFLKGWRGVFVATVRVPGELPTGLRAWSAQQKRWAAGIGEVAWKMLPSLLFRSGLSGAERWGALFPLVTWLGYLSFSATVVLAVTAMLLQPSVALSLGRAVCAPVALLVVALFAVMLSANRFLRPGTPIGPLLLAFPAAMVLSANFSWASFRSVPATVMGRRRVFERTAKHGVAGTSG